MIISDFENLSAEHLQCINVVGLSGSGKSTFARRLATALRTDCIEMDQLFHGPHWAEPEVEDFRQRVAAAIAGGRWVLDGNYHSKTHDLKWERATAIVWMNTPFLRNMYQSTTRAIHRAWTQEELWPGTGNRESFQRTFFSRQSILLWALANFRRIQNRYSAIRDEPRWSQLCFIELRSRQDAERLINVANEVARSQTLRASASLDEQKRHQKEERTRRFRNGRTTRR